MEVTLERGFVPRKELIKWGLAIITSAVVGCVTFYFTTTARLDTHESKIEALSNEKASTKDIEYIREDIRGIKEDLRDLKSGNQRIYEILLEKEKEMK